MNQLFRLVILPALLGLAVAALILRYMFPSTDLSSLDKDISEHAPSPYVSTNPRLQSRSGPVSYADAVNKATPAVVNIYTAKVIQQRRHPLFDDPFFRQFFGRKGEEPKLRRMQSSLGSGVLISQDGYLLTNNHVIANADEIVVALQDGRESFATVVGTDPDTDLAILRVDITNAPVIEIAPSGTVVGDVALAIGNPFGVGQTVTMGIISATGRNQLGLTKFEDFIQTDAAINPGNSGGALINAYGQLIGINTAIFSKSGGSQGIGFAIPAGLAKKITQEIIEHGYVIRGWLGIEVQQMNSSLSRSFGLKELTGVLVAGVQRNGPAFIAGLRPGDILLKVDGIQVVDGHQTMKQITETAPGKTISIGVLRNGSILQLEALIGSSPRKNYPE